jgi:hypothetical protein
VRSRYRTLVAGLLVVAVAAAGIALNLALLGLTQESSDPVGRLSPRAILDTPARANVPAGTTTTPATTTNDHPRTVTDGSRGDGSNDGKHANDDDD